MAKRKRLRPVDPGRLETNFAAPPPPTHRAPIADVASEASSHAALEEVSETLARAREEGRMVLSLPLDAIDMGYLVRDRIVAEDGETEALKASLLERGQQMPIEVVETAPGRYGLISGWRRCTALAALADETGEGRFDRVQALLRRPAEMSDAYLSMVEENEIRANLSFFERARIAAKAVDQGVFETEKQALLTLYHAASRAKRSKIRSFLPLVRELDGVLHHPQAIGERLGLKLSKRIEEDARFAAALRKRLAGLKAPDAAAEQRCLNVALNAKAPATPPAPAYTDHDIRPGLTLRHHQGRGKIEISGQEVDDALAEKLLDWLAK